MGFRAVCIESRCKCTYAGGYLVVTKTDGTTRIHLSEISSVTFCTTKVFLSAYLLSEFAKRKIPVVFSDEKYLPVAECLPIHGTYNGSASIASQLQWSVPCKKRLWKTVVQHKIGLQATVLENAGNTSAATVLRNHMKAVKSGDSTNREAVAAATYFPALFGEPFTRDLDCPLNTSLDYGYSIVLSRVAREIASHGYLTQIGIHHRGELNPWNLACDLMEPFRPYIDTVIMRAGKDDFDANMRRQLIQIMSDSVKYGDGYYRLGSVVTYYVRDCLSAMERAIQPEDIKIYELKA